MKSLFCFFLCLSVGISQASELKTIEINHTPLYHHVCAAEKSNGQLIVFLHGSVAAFQGQTESRSAAIDVLLENNSAFLPTFNKEGFDVVLPIAYNEFNWLDSSGNTYLQAIIDLYKDKYQQIYLAGFSDGGTGAYKFFNQHPESFSGVLLFNAYPQHQNFYKQVDYQKTQGKKILFIAQDKDKVTPYEFPLVAYRRHKIMNGPTYFLLEKGQHEFVKYDAILFTKIMNIIKIENVTNLVTNHDSISIYPPIDGFLDDNALDETFKFRKSIGKGFGMKATEYAPQAKELSEFVNQGDCRILPIKINRHDLNKMSFTFYGTLNGKAIAIELPNYLVLPPW